MMNNRIRELGTVKIVQVQPSGLVIKTPKGNFYDVSRRVEVDRLTITPEGIEAVTRQGAHVLDIHHLRHPDKAYENDDLVCIGFSSHYAAMRERFGAHMVDGSAGENIIIDFPDEVWVDDIGSRIGIENAETGQIAFLDLARFAAPCSAFSHFAANSQERALPPETLKSTLQFLNNGRRGYLFVMRPGADAVIVQPGDRVFVAEAS